MNSWLMSLMTATSRDFRYTRYSFSQRATYSLMVRCVLRYFLDLLNWSQSLSRSQFLLESPSCLMTFMRCLKASSPSRCSLSASSRTLWLLRTKQQRNRQQCSWFIRIWLFWVSVFLLRASRISPPDRFEATVLSRGNTSMLRCWSLALANSTLFSFFLIQSFYSGFTWSNLESDRLRNSDCPMRSEQFIAHIFLSRDFMLADSPYLSGIRKGTVVILRTKSLSVRDSQGVQPTMSSYSMIPIEKMSLLGEYRFYTSASGGMYKGVPTLYLALRSPTLLTANPKSPIFHPSLLFKMLAGFRSRWMMLFSIRYLQPPTTHLMMSMASCSLSFPRLEMWPSKSPYGQYSVTMQHLFAVRQMSWHRRTLGWARVLMIQIQLDSISMLELVYFFNSMTLTAQTSVLPILRALQTLLLYPRPISWDLEQTQSPIFWSSSSLIAAGKLGSFEVEPTHLSFLASSRVSLSSGEKQRLLIQQFYYPQRYWERPSIQNSLHQGIGPKNAQLGFKFEAYY